MSSFILINNNYKKKKGGKNWRTIKKKIKEKLNVVPLEPGCYLMKKLPFIKIKKKIQDVVTL